MHLTDKIPKRIKLCHIIPIRRAIAESCLLQPPAPYVSFRQDISQDRSWGILGQHAPWYFQILQPRTNQPHLEWLGESQNEGVGKICISIHLFKIIADSFELKKLAQEYLPHSTRETHVLRLYVQGSDVVSFNDFHGLGCEPR